MSCLCELSCLYELNCLNELSCSNLRAGQSCLAVPLLGPEKLQAIAQDTIPCIHALSQDTEAATYCVLEAYKHNQSTCLDMTECNNMKTKSGKSIFVKALRMQGYGVKPA